MANTHEQIETRGGVSSAKLARIKRILSAHPRGTVIDGNGKVLALGDGTRGSGRRSLERGKTATRCCSPQIRQDLRRCLAQVDAWRKSHPTMKERCDAVRAKVAEQFRYD